MYKASFPLNRMRRLRQSPWIRDLVAETSLSAQDFIWPCFVIEGTNKQEAISSMPGVFRYSIDVLVQKAKEAQDLGIPCIALFPNTDPSLKTDDGVEATNPDNLICRAVAAVKVTCPNLGIMCDVALDPYTTHGHDGILDAKGNIDNDETVEILSQQALVQAQAGCDILGPSDMMDGRIKAIRNALEQAQFHDTLIMSYAAKYASAFYGPFREAVGSKSNLKTDKRTYQQNPKNALEALDEVEQDLKEGADMVMVKPGLPYLDIIYRVQSTFKVPTFAYHVSGEYSMLKAAAEKGYLDDHACMLESLIALKRAGCSGILTYAALDIVKQL